MSNFKRFLDGIHKIIQEQYNEHLDRNIDSFIMIVNIKRNIEIYMTQHVKETMNCEKK
ncbi:hypothetical protein LCGC14_3162090 [marine sediment metagenome]|uniref:Uncharacterized protein n=1 Tax=marine sediment metagenome TaxID=412755 RepID=A0A0F8XXM8_9ZZZZ